MEKSQSETQQSADQLLDAVDEIAGYVEVEAKPVFPEPEQEDAVPVEKEAVYPDEEEGEQRRDEEGEGDY